MGKTSSIFILLLMVNVIGYVLLTDYVDAYPLTAGESIHTLVNNNALLALYGTEKMDLNVTTYEVKNDSLIYTSVPTVPDESFFSTVGSFIDRIFILFGFIRTFLAIALFPITMISLLGLPWQLSMLLGIPLATLYIFGIIDIFSSSGT